MNRSSANIHEKNKKIAAVGISVALVVVLQALAELLQKIGMPLSLALGIIPVLVAAQLYGAKTGAVVGGFFGIISLIIAAFNSAALPIAKVVINPIVSVLPRIAVGTVCGLVFKWINGAFLKRDAAVAQKRLPFASLIATLSGIITNTVLFLGSFFLFAHGNTYGDVTVDFKWILASVVALNTAIELVLFSAIVPCIVTVLHRKN